ncbi:MAG: collagen-like protein [Bacteroidia bacterium]|nr:collagen-like protein [Bacteroidia bacterium]
MTSKLVKGSLLLIALMTVSFSIMGQNTVPMGIHYQAVARNSAGNELANTKISVRFSVISEDPLSTPIFQEVHQNVITSRFGVFSLVIGHGVSTGNYKSKSLSEIAWDQANHYLKVEVQFENDYMDMGTMPFLAVPYALYAQKSLEPGPAGPKGDRGEKGESGDPASDDQSLSFDGSNLSISGSTSTVSLVPLLQNLEVSNDGTGGYNLALTRGNTINLATIEKDGDPTNELQNLILTQDDKLKITNSSLDPVSLSPYRQTLMWDTTAYILGISGTTSNVNLSKLKNDADASPTNEIQDIILKNDSLKISKNSASTGVSLSKYLVDNDKQALKWDPVKRRLGIIGDTATINLSELKNDADASPTNEIQDLQLISNKLSITGKTGAKEINMNDYLDNTDSQTITYTEGTNELEITGGNKITIGSMVAFRAKKTSSETVTTWMKDYDFITNPPDYNDGGGYAYVTSIFTAPSAGIFTFSINYTATGSGDSRVLKIFLNGALYETLNSGISNGSTITRQITMKLDTGDYVNIKINVGTGYDTGIGTFSGFKVY